MRKARDFRRQGLRRQRALRPCGTTRLTRPIASASAALTARPVRMRSSARPMADEARQAHGAAIDQRHAEAARRRRQAPHPPRRPADRTTAPARARRRPHARRLPRSPACRGACRVGPIGASRSRPPAGATTRLPCPAAIALRSAPAQKVPFAPWSTATRAPSSRRTRGRPSASAAAVARSTALRASGRSSTTVVTGPWRSILMLPIILPYQVA